MKNIKILNEILINNAQKHPNLPALTMKWGYRDINYTYSELYKSSLEVAVWFKKNNITKGDKVIIMAPIALIG